MTYTETIKYYTNLIHQTIQQSFLSKHLNSPELDIHKIVAIDNLVKDKPNQDELVRTTMLVQIALNTHDQINVHFNEENVMEQQLTVLAGDYYSGIYYHLLANIENISFIRLLADGINEMTQAKMTFYYSKYRDFNHFMSDYKEIECVLIDKVAQYVNKSDDNHYLNKWIILKRLEFELVSLQKGNNNFFHRLAKENIATIQDNQQLAKALKEYIKKVSHELDTLTVNNEQVIIPKEIDLYQLRSENTWNLVLEEGLSQ
ncbi:heptaprenyl diphosphate synthase component 1 [Gracilibacillus caseinilyticus]|uniref:Heptaprenyl diphosphate synthase component 1 n=1 Tax=Gracilibacillus caseinilyticus TaxID=2932256 RepID=A0ABY4ET26_9BACI|nr:heptaprenyl diphosphate synthase component 1 [Gracilibacillus caseinilyticus]UOQ47574.1 heptaprenyl diphosphate synthase component 1 [Gracilibacillus caseinilyticus]